MDIDDLCIGSIDMYISLPPSISIYIFVKVCDYIHDGCIMSQSEVSINDMFANPTKMAWN